ncbi:acyltransferase family protein [Massilia putida]|uniref:acyltransferase family protein n=1 Tax=Massilia putida TaxID=1141883 RepID=UPI0012EC689B|nr:acyltransferase [Massilia putida]
MLISLMRGLAALQVVAAHLRAEMFPGLRDIASPPIYYQALAFTTGFAHQAVVVFFLISGWLVGGSLLNKLDRASASTCATADDASPWLAYAIDRLTRLWTVLVPALCLMLLVGVVTEAIDPARADVSTVNEYSTTAFIGNLVGLQTVVVENFGGNYALWSLANETWYYIQFPLLLIMFTSRNRVCQAGAAALLLVLGASLPWSITLYCALWLLGAAFSRIRIDCGGGARVVLIALAATCSIYFRLRGSNNDLNVESFVQDLMYSLPLLAVLASMQAPLAMRSSRMRIVARIAHTLSEFSFTLYVTHIPIIKLLRYIGLQTFGRDRLSPHAPLDYAVYAGMLVVVLAAAWLSYLLFESHTFRVRRAVKNALQPRPRRASMASSSMK